MCSRRPGPYGEETMPSRSKASAVTSRWTIDWKSSGSVPPISELTKTRGRWPKAAAANKSRAKALRISYGGYRSRCEHYFGAAENQTGQLSEFCFSKLLIQQ